MRITLNQEAESHLLEIMQTLQLKNPTHTLNVLLSKAASGIEDIHIPRFPQHEERTQHGNSTQ